MFFNSQLFVLLFLPLTIGVYYCCAGSRNARLNFLCLASLFFYAYWDVRLLPLLLGSITANWLLIRAFDALGKRRVLIAGIVLNLVLLSVFKYADFLADSVMTVLGEQHDRFNIVLPLAISFFTFQQISYLVDVERGTKERYSFRDYLMYVTFFPQLVAGPIVRHSEIIDQFDLDPRRSGLWERLSRGMFLFWMGMAKKLLIADEAAKIVDPLYLRAFAGEGIAVADAWTACSAFALQVYFDFSGYSDMAIGLGLIFGFTLPLNFDAPYRAVVLRDTWRRWHMTLTRFLRDYLYIPLGGSRRGTARTMFNVIITLMLVGLWHGAAWTFVLFGLAHGLALTVHGAWSRLHRPLPRPVAWLLTMGFWIATLAFWRGHDVASGARMTASLFGAHGDAVASQPLTWVLPVGAFLALAGPTSQVIALERLKPARALGVAMGLATLLLLLKIGGELEYEFIYFQF